MLPNRRSYFRFDVPLRVTLDNLQNGGQSLTGTTKNLSRNGLCFETDSNDLMPNDRIELAIEIPDSESYPLLADVMWKQQVDNRCLTGVKIVSMDSEAKSEVLDYAYDMWLNIVRNRKTVDMAVL
ncbi:MAG: PilZ domain-containing protein [Nitrospiraceae bacterium]|nr:MAG: PilZ domain-containing protein [Nitrospiraceae bacterium]